MSLNIHRWIFIFYNRYVERFLSSVADHNELMSIFRMNSSLIKKKNRVHHCNVWAWNNQLNDIWLKWQWISIWLNYRIELANIYHHFFFSFFWNVLLNAEEKIIEENKFNNSEEFVITMQLIENIIHQISILLIKRINFRLFRNFNFSIKLEKNFHSIVYFHNSKFSIFL